MASGTTSGTISFLGKEFNLKLLDQAISKSNETYIEAGKEVHEAMFNQSLLPADWATKFKKPVVTIHEGKYVFIVATPTSAADSIGMTGEGSDAKLIVHTGFKAKFVTKYNFNQSKVPEVAETPIPVATPPVSSYQDKRSAPWKPNNGFQKNQSDSYQGNSRFGKS